MKNWLIGLFIGFWYGVLCTVSVDGAFVEAHKVYNPDTDRHGITIVNTNLLYELFLRKRHTTCMIDNWDEFCPLDHTEKENGNRGICWGDK